MRRHVKPVRKCHACPLNLGDHCWLYACPRGQWRSGRACPARENEEIHAAFRRWEKLPVVKTRRDLRREFFRANRRTLPPAARAGRR